LTISPWNNHYITADTQNLTRNSSSNPGTELASNQLVKGKSKVIPVLMHHAMKLWGEWKQSSMDSLPWN